MSRVANTPTVNPAARGLDPNFHYVRVEKENPRFEESQLDGYLDPSDPEHPVYEVASEDRKVTGNSRMALLKTPIADYLRYEKAVTERAERNLKPKKADNEQPGGDVIGAYTEFESDGDVLKA